MSADFLLYGSYGYTGRLIARRALELGLKPLLAGRMPHGAVLLGVLAMFTLPHQFHVGVVEWLARLEDLGQRHGFSEPPGPQHHALFLRAGSRLLVTFESVRSARRSPGGRPRGFDRVTRQGLVAPRPPLPRGDLLPRPRCLEPPRPLDR